MHSRGTRFFEVLAADVRYAWRGLCNAPGYAVTIVLTLALGLGAVTTLLAIVDSVLLRPIALPHPEQLVAMSVRGDQPGTTYLLSYKQVETLRRETHLFTTIGAYASMARPVGAADGTRVALLTTVSSNVFDMLGVHARYGRLFGPKDEKAPVAVVSSMFWHERLHGDPGAIGSTMKVSGQLRTIVGVLPEGLSFPQSTEAPVVYTPISLNAEGKDDFFGDNGLVMARLKPGVSMQQGLEEARSIFNHAQSGVQAGKGTLQMLSYQQFLTGNMQSALWALLGAGSVLLLIACANAANLQIARATGRLAEMNVRSALGASFTRLVQQVVTESLVVSLLGAALGGALAYALVGLIRHAYRLQFARFDELAIHPTVLVVCTMLAVLAGLLASLAPVLRIRRQMNATAATRTTRRSKVPGILVAVQISLTCVLLVTSGLFVQTFRALKNVNLGFDPHHLTTLVLMPENQHKDFEASRQLDASLLERFAALPGVESATMQTAIPFSNYNFYLNGRTDVNGRAYHEGDTAFYSLVSTNFVHAIGLDLLKGRGFLPQDDGTSAMVAVVNEAFVKKFLSGRDPVGATVKFHRNADEKDSDVPFTQPLTVVGVVGNELQGGDLGAPFEPTVYMDYRQLPKTSILAQIFSFESEFAIRSALPQATLDKELRAAIHQTAPDMAEMNLVPTEEAITQSLGQRRLALRLVSSFGAVALLLAAIGIYGVLAYSVVQRRREIGIRMALGSSRAGATRLVLQQAAVMVLFGLALGTAGAWPAGRAVRSFLFGVHPLDLRTLCATALVLLLVCAAAAVIPAWRSAQVDPMEALRTE